MGHRDAMVAVANEIGVANLDELDRRQLSASQHDHGDVLPALSGMALQGIPPIIEITTAALTAANASDGHGLHAPMMDIVAIDPRGNLPKAEQPSGPACESRPGPV
jgi:hypothetical protein